MGQSDENHDVYNNLTESRKTPQKAVSGILITQLILWNPLQFLFSFRNGQST